MTTGCSKMGEWLISLRVGPWHVAGVTPENSWTVCRIFLSGREICIDCSTCEAILVVRHYDCIYTFSARRCFYVCWLSRSPKFVTPGWPAQILSIEDFQSPTLLWQETPRYIRWHVTCSSSCLITCFQKIYRDAFDYEIIFISITYVAYNKMPCRLRQHVLNTSH